VLGFALVLLLLLLNSGIAYWNTRSLIRNERAVAQSHQLVTELAELLSTVKDAETGARGYVITGQDSYLEPYESAMARMKDELAPLALLIAANPTQQARVPILRDQINARLALCRQSIELRRERGFAAAQAFIASGAGKAEMDGVRLTLGEMEADERAVLATHAAESAASARGALTTLVLAALLNVLLLGYVWLLLARAETQREELATAYVDLKRAEEMRDGLTAMLVHDLRTPLTTMIGSLEMLHQQQGEPLPPDLQQELIGMSAQGAHRLLGLVNELLDISKMEAGEMHIRRETVQVPETVDRAVAQVAALDMGDRAHVVRDFAPDLPLVNADQELLTRVVINLVGNALKFTPRDGQVTVSARVIMPLREGPKEALLLTQQHPLGDPDPVMLFSVRDTGEGIPQADLSRVFDKFGQVESRKAGRKMSTGLGLTFCKLAVEAHGGRIWVESELGKGSTFFFTVPLRPWEIERTETGSESQQEAVVGVV